MSYLTEKVVTSEMEILDFKAIVTEKEELDNIHKHFL